MNRDSHCKVLGLAIGIVALASSGALAQDAKQRLFGRVFGKVVELDANMVVKVKAGKAGERHFVDTDGDGKNDEVWYIDTAVRHQEARRPVLVRVIDEDGDLDAHMGGDLDSDLYVADWTADGTVDAVVDYVDTDGDQDVDEMGMYYFVPKYAYLGGGPGLLVWWGRDVGDDNLLWYDVNFNYQQPDCQYRSHFSGNEVFLQFGMAEGDTEWRSIWENPFAFYDPDGDGCAEIVIRLSGQGSLVEALRYSFDADDDAFGKRTHDYDFSITAVGAGRYLEGTDAAKVTYPKSITKGMTLRGIPTEPWVQVEHAQSFAMGAPWDRVLLTWDEMNANTDGNVDQDPHERWEGILNHKSTNFPQVGGPPCSALNKRNEVSFKPIRPMKLYYEPADRRFHLVGANEGWVHVDFDLDGKVDAEYLYSDEDEDGFLDRRRIDVDADGKIDFDWTMTKGKEYEFALAWKPISVAYKTALTETLAESQQFIDAAKGALGKNGKPVDADPAETFFLTELVKWVPETRLGARMRETPAGARFYMDLVRDRLLKKLKVAYGDHAAWEGIESTYAAGKYGAAAVTVREELVKKALDVDLSFGGFGRRIPIHFDSSGRGQRVNWPVAIAVKNLKAAVKDFNPRNCAVVAGDRWLGYRQVAHQMDAIDPSIGEALSFLIDIPAEGKATYFVYDSPTGEGKNDFPMKTDITDKWVPPNVAWESNVVGYRTYWGQFDFFGKKQDRLVLHNFGTESYHSEVSWGIDALHVGKTSGLGGVSLYVGDRAYPVQNPAGEGEVKFEKKLLTKGPVRAAIEIAGTNVVPAHPEWKVSSLCIVYAERMETEIQVTVTGPKGANVVGPGIVKLPRERVFADPGIGAWGSWGYQEAVIDEIGMGLMATPTDFAGLEDLEAERRIKLRTDENGRVRFWLIGDWRRGRQHPIAPTIDNWQKELTALAAKLYRNVKVEIGSAERW